MYIIGKFIKYSDKSSYPTPHFIGVKEMPSLNKLKSYLRKHKDIKQMGETER